MFVNTERMDGPCPDVTDRAFDGEALATDRYVPGTDELLTTVVELIETERELDLSNQPPIGESVDWDALDGLLDDERRAVNVASVTFTYADVLVRITGDGEISLYETPTTNDAITSGASAPPESSDEDESPDG